MQPDWCSRGESHLLLIICKSIVRWLLKNCQSFVFLSCQRSVCTKAENQISPEKYLSPLSHLSCCVGTKFSCLGMIFHPLLFFLRTLCYQDTCLPHHVTCFSWLPARFHCVAQFWAFPMRSFFNITLRWLCHLMKGVFSLFSFSLSGYKACFCASNKMPPHLLVSLLPWIPTKPIGHVDHMALHSLIDCTTSHTFMTMTCSGTN